jgi:glycosyltransferase involved in cell wall biosynthesis
LVENGYQVVLVIQGPPAQAEQLAALSDIAGIEIVATDHALEWMDPEGQDFTRACEELSTLARDKDVDLVHLNSFREAAADWHVPVLVVAHSCVSSWWRACRGGAPDEARWEAYVRSVKAGLDSAAVWVAATQSFVTEMQDLYSPQAEGRVIRNGVEPVEIGAAKEPFILSAGRLWDEAKNLSALKSAAHGSVWPIVVAGAANFGNEPAPQADGLQLCGHVARPQLLALMRRAAIYAAPARYEPFGLSILEAAGAGCALVLSDIPSLRELWHDAALFVDLHDPLALPTALNRLCSDDGARRKLQMAALLRSRRYTLSEMSAAYCELYEELLSPPSYVPDGHSSVLAEIRQ